MRIWPPLAAPELRHVVGRQHLHFLDGVHVLDADDVAGRPRADGRCAVDRDVVLVVAAAVDVVAAVPEVVEAVVVEAAADDAGLEAGHADRVAAVQRHLLDVLGFDGLPDRDVGLQRRGFGRDGDRLGHVAGLERELQGERAGGIELHVALHVLLEALQAPR